MNTANVPPSANKPDTSDSLSVATAHTDNSLINKPKEITEFNIKIEFAATRNDASVPVMKLHRDLITCICLAHPNTIMMFDKHNTPVTASSLATIKSVTDHSKLFDVHSKAGNSTRKTKHTIIQHIKTTHSLSDIKNHFDVMDFLRKNNVYLRFHYFSDTVWDVTSPGWLYGKHPSQSDHATIKNDLDTAMKKMFPKATIPYYHLAYCSPSATKASDGKRMSTKSLEIQVDRKDSRELDKMLRDSHKDNTIYIKWKYRHSMPDHYRNCIIAQHKYLANTYTVPINGVTRDQMFYILNPLLQNKLIRSVESTKKTDSHGRWNVLCNAADFPAASKFVTEVLATFDVTVPSDVAAAPKSFPSRISGTIPSDGSSDGDQSYATTSMRSFASVVTDGDCDLHIETPSISFDLSYMQSDTTTTVASTVTSARELELETSVKKLSQQVSALMLQLANATATAAPTQIPQIVPPSADDRLSAMEEKNNQLLLAMQPSTTTTEASDASALEHVHKKQDVKDTPEKSLPVTEVEGPRPP
jgi:hypothetical protein